VAAQATRQTGAPAASAVAVVDISHVFKNHQRFKDLMEGLKQEVRRIEEQLRARHQDIETHRQKLTQFRAGSEEYKRTEADMARLQAQLQATRN
jgi:Skp family chaperone for outer membrane proteins